jgi:DNA gyrase subunit B
VQEVKFDKDSIKVSEWTAQVSVVNALSNRRATVHSTDGRFYEQEYEKKGALYPVKQIGERL